MRLPSRKLRFFSNICLVKRIDLRTFKKKKDGNNKKKTVPCHVPVLSVHLGSGPVENEQSPSEGDEPNVCNGWDGRSELPGFRKKLPDFFLFFHLARRF